MLSTTYTGSEIQNPSLFKKKKFSFCPSFYLILYLCSSSAKFFNSIFEKLILIQANLDLIRTCVIRIFVFTGRKIGRPIQIINPVCIIWILPNLDKNVGSTSVQIQQVCLHINFLFSSLGIHSIECSRYSCKFMRIGNLCS